MAFKSGKKESEIFVGIPEKVKGIIKKGDSVPQLNCLEAMSKNRQVTLAIKVDPAVWERPEFSAQPTESIICRIGELGKGHSRIWCFIKFS